MPKKTLPRLLSVQPTGQPLTLHLRWDNGLDTNVDLSNFIDQFKLYQPLRLSPALFESVRLGDYGTDIVWTPDMDMSADSLWRLTQEQSGQTMSTAAFKLWRIQQDYTLDAAAQALGLSRRMVAYYEDGTKPIPRVVALATRALQRA